MGIDKTGLEIILISHKLISNNKKNALSLARQQLHINNHCINNMLCKYNFNNLVNKYNSGEYFENLFLDIGFENTDSIDF